MTLLLNISALLIGIGVGILVWSNDLWSFRDAVEHGFDKGLHETFPYVGSEKYNEMESRKKKSLKLFWIGIIFFFGGLSALTITITILCQ